MTKVSELDAASTLAGTEQVAVTQGGSTRRANANAIANTVSQGRFTNTGLKILDAVLANTLTVKVNETLGSDKTLSVTTGAADRSVALLEDFNWPGLTHTPQDLNGAGAVNLTTLTTFWGTTGTDAGTLADGATGQIKIIIMDADGGDGTLTPDNFGNGTTITFDAVGESIGLVFYGGNWWVLFANGATVA